MSSGAGTIMADGATYLSFDVAGEGFALPLQAVREIVRLPPLVRVPQSPASLEGLGNLRGRILPVVSVSGLLRRPRREPTEATRVLVLDRGTFLGLSVDAVGGLLVADGRRIEEDDQSTILRGSDGDHRLLDPEPLLAADFKAQPRRLRSEQARPAEPAGREGDGPEGHAEFIGFRIADQDYALPLDGVREVLRLPSDLAAWPSEDSAVLGVATIRGRAVPILSGPALLGLPLGSAPDGGARVIVTSQDEMTFGVLVDRTTGIHRVDASRIDPVPAILSRGLRPEAEVQSIARVDGRLVAMLSPDRLLSRERMEHVTTGDDQGGDRLEQASDPEPARQFVLFRLEGTECAVPIGSVDEVARVPDRYSTVPRAPAYVRGVMMLHGQALPVIDLRIRLDLPHASPSNRERILVLSSKGLRAGFVVDDVREVANLPASAIEPAPDLTDGRRMVVTQAANLAGAGRLILILDVDRLIEGTEMLAEDPPVS